MSLSRYLSKLAALVGSDGKVPAAGIADGAITNAKLSTDLDASKITAGTLPIARIADGAVTTAKLATGAVTQAKIGHITSGSHTRNNDVWIPINTAYPISIVTFSGRHTSGGVATGYLTLKDSANNALSGVEWNNLGWYRGTSGIAANSSYTYGKLNQDSLKIDQDLQWGGVLVVSQPGASFGARPNVTGHFFYTYTGQGAAFTLVNGSHNSSTLISYLGFDWDASPGVPDMTIQYQVTGVTTV